MGSANAIEICYIDTTTLNSAGNTDNGGSATISLSGPLATDYIQYSCNVANNVTAGTYIRFDPP